MSWNQSVRKRREGSPHPRVGQNPVRRQEPERTPLFVSWRCSSLFSSAAERCPSTNAYWPLDSPLRTPI